MELSKEQKEKIIKLSEALKEAADKIKMFLIELVEKLKPVLLKISRIQKEQDIQDKEKAKHRSWIKEKLVHLIVRLLIPYAGRHLVDGSTRKLDILCYRILMKLPLEKYAEEEEPTNEGRAGKYSWNGLYD